MYKNFKIDIFNKKTNNFNLRKKFNLDLSEHGSISIV